MNGTDSISENGDNRKRKNSTLHCKNIPKKSKPNAKFEFGNYNRYYGYRNVNECNDVRLEIFQNRRELFENKDVLDIGCNIGHVTYIIARDFAPKSVLGIDIDSTLITIARKNLRHYEKETTSNNKSQSPSTLKSESSSDDSEQITISKISQHENNDKKDNRLKFPHNVSFIHGNYVLDHDNLLHLEEPRYDVILCLSVTKWIQLNWGDDALKRVFKRIYAQLRSGGIFILEAQLWESYKKRKLSAKLKNNCRKIRFYPNMFHEYLLSEVSFSKNEVLAVPSHSSKGFQRPISIYYKS